MPNLERAAESKLQPQAGWPRFVPQPDFCCRWRIGSGDSREWLLVLWWLGAETGYRRRICEQRHRKLLREFGRICKLLSEVHDFPYDQQRRSGELRGTRQLGERGTLSSLPRSSRARDDGTGRVTGQPRCTQLCGDIGVILPGHVNDQRRAASGQLVPIRGFAAGSLMRG